MKVYKYDFTDKGEATFLALPKDIRQRIEKKLRYFIQSENPLYFAEPIKESNKFFRFRIGDYRVIFSLQDEQTFIILLIQKVGHRRDIYT